MIPVIKEPGTPIGFLADKSLDEVLDNNIREAKKLLAEIMVSSFSHFKKNLYVDLIYQKKEKEFIEQFKSNPNILYCRKSPSTIAAELLKLRFLAQEEYFRMYS